MKFSRVKGTEFVAWLHTRFPERLAASTFKKGRSALCQLLNYAIANGWADETVLASLPKAPPSPPRQEWLRPEQVRALDAFVTDDHFTPQQRFMWSCLLNTGVRPNELVQMQARHLNPIDETLAVLGKGSGEGKLRHVPLSAHFTQLFLAYLNENEISGEDWLFPEMAVRFVEGDDLEYEHVITDSSKHCSTKSVRAAVAKVGDLAAKDVKDKRLEAALVPTFTITPKVLRRTYACTHLIASELMDPGEGMDIRSIQQALGHESLDTTAIYLSDVANHLSRYRRAKSVTQTVQVLAEMAEAHQRVAA